MSRKKKYKPADYDGASSRHININYQVMTSKAFLSCSNNARLLYVCMRAEQYGTDAYKHPNKDNTQFIFAKKQYNDKYKLFTNATQFRKTRDELIEKGLIKCIEDNSHIRKANVYTYSDKWKYYKPDKPIDASIATKSLRNKINLENTKE